MIWCTRICQDRHEAYILYIPEMCDIQRTDTPRVKNILYLSIPMNAPNHMRAEPLALRNPVILAAGLLGDSPKKLRAAYDAGAGAVVTKSITIEPREGNSEPTFIREQDGWLNSVGLKNPGAKAFSRMLGHPDYPVIVSLAGSLPNDFVHMAGLFRSVVAFELNISCPNVDGPLDSPGQDPVLTGQVVAAMKDCVKVPVFVKVGINMRGAVKAAVDAGADGITAINTIPAMKIDPDTGRPLFGNGRCGLSGPPIRPIALNEVYHIAASYRIPVVGCGGVSSGADALSFIQAGAWAVQVGSAAMDDIGILSRIADGLARLV